MKLKSLFLEVIEVFIIALVIFFAIYFMVQSFVIEQTSMEPNLHPGQHVLVNKTAYWFNRNPHRGDVVVAHHPTTSEDVVKRVIGLPGDTVEVKRDGTVYINGNLLLEPYIESLHLNSVGGTWSVPEGHYFLMGDNRNVSVDSRSWGPVPRNKIIGKTWIIIWPLGDWGFAPNKSPELEATTQQSLVPLDLELCIN